MPPGLENVILSPSIARGRIDQWINDYIISTSHITRDSITNIILFNEYQKICKKLKLRDTSFLSTSHENRRNELRTVIDEKIYKLRESKR
jgi:hypothetical protein